MSGKPIALAAAMGLLVFQASLGYVMFGVYGPRDFPPDFPFDYYWWPLEVGVFGVPFVAGLLLPKWRMLAAVLLVGAIGALVPATTLHGWSWWQPIGFFGVLFSICAALLFGVAVMLRMGVERGIGHLRRRRAVRM